MISEDLRNTVATLEARGAAALADPAFFAALLLNLKSTIERTAQLERVARAVSGEITIPAPPAVPAWMRQVRPVAEAGRA